MQRDADIANQTYSSTESVTGTQKHKKFADVIVLKKHQSTIESFILNCKDDVRSWDNKN